MIKFLATFLISFLAYLFIPRHVHAQAMLRDLADVFSRIVSSLLGLVGVGFVIMLVIGGYNYLNAGSNKESAVKASRGLTYAIIGLVITLSAVIIITILGTFLGIPNFGVFNICIGTSGC